MANIPVTKTFLPDQEKYQNILQKVWDNKWITNRGELVRELESKLSKRFDTNGIILTTNGTLPLQIAIKALNLKGDIITTPFSYVATTAAIVWENCTPIFVDIHPEYLTIDETKIEAAITSNTSAILATHVYGNPCNIEKIEEIATKHNLKVIYDAAHCFDVDYKGKSVFNYGDVSTCSFHATKLFHTGEGGAIFANQKSTFDKLYYHHNFGHKGPLDFHGLGINAKMSELQAAMGLCVFPYMEHIKNERKKVVNFYNKHLDTDKISTLKIRVNTDWNFSYYPILFNSENELLTTENRLNNHNILPRRYFNPSLNNLPYVTFQKMPIADSVSKRILCLPLYVGLSEKNLELIVKLIND